MTARSEKMKVSVIVPCYNETDSVVPLADAVRLALTAYDYQLVLVDDGSTDSTAARIAEASAADSRVTAVYLRTNYGQTAAISAGFEAATGDVLVPMDADLQNDPADIPRLLEKLAEGFDVVSGWRRDRKDKNSRVWSSRLANVLIRKMTGVRINDFGCTLKAYRRDILDSVRLYGEMHRYIPVYAHWNGARITELPVAHHPRRFGSSKYGFERVLKVLLDLLVIKLLGSYATKPIHLFGGLGGALALLGGVCITYTAYMRFFEDVFVKDQPSFLVGIFLWLVAGQLVMMGLVAELVIRVYHEARGGKPYQVRSQPPSSTSESGNV